jgi:hypothetical protein
LSVDTSRPQEFAEPREVVRPSPTGGPPISPGFTMLSPQSADAMWLITPGPAGTSFNSFGLGVFPPTPPTNPAGNGSDMASVAAAAANAVASESASSNNVKLEDET